MPDKLNKSEKKMTAMLVNQMFVKANKIGITYRMLAPLLKVKSHVTIWRWRNKGNTPSRHHIYWIKKFLGLSLA